MMSKRAQILKLVKYVKPGMKVADMGAGDGEALVAMVNKGAVWGEGWEIEPWYYLKAQVGIWKARRQGAVKVRFGDMWKAHLGDFDLVYVYQLPRYAKKFGRKCKQEMKKGAVVVANTYPLVGLGESKRDGEMYVYRI